MRKCTLCCCAVVALTSTAGANFFTNSKPLLMVDELLFSPGAQQIFTFDVTMAPGKPVVGIWFHGEYWDDGPGGPTFWASDLQMQIISPGGNSWTVGGFNDVALGASDENWNGWNGSSPGPTAANGGALPFSAFPNDGLDPTGAPFVTLWSEHFPWKDIPEPKEGVWTVNFAADFPGVPGPMKWTNIEIMLHNIPAPGGLALAGVAGLFMLKRRR